MVADEGAVRPHAPHHILPECATLPEGAVAVDVKELEGFVRGVEEEWKVKDKTASEQAKYIPDHQD